MKRALLSRLLSALALALAALPAAPAPHPARALAGTWTQTEWTTPSTTLAVAASGTNQFYLPTVAGYGVLTGTFGVCAGAGAWCQGSGDTASGQTLRLAGNHKSDQANPWSSDLNADGVSELLFANRHYSDTITATHVFNGGYIYWGGGAPSSPNWSAAFSTTLPTIGAGGVSVADLNGDGRPEVIFANYHDGSTYNVNSYIYWGQAGGPQGVTYSPAVSTGLPTIGAHAIAVADLNGDGRPEVIFANSYNGSTHNINSYIYWGQAGGPQGVTYSPAVSTGLPTSGAASVAVADLNGDGRPEVIFSNYFNGSTRNVNSIIYWGQAGAPYGVTYSAAVSTTLPTSGAEGVAVADLNGDGRPEVIFANFYNDSTYNVNSYIYWGQAGGPQGVTYTPAISTGLPGVGAMKASVADVNNDGQRDVVVLNYHGGFTRVFWGPLPGSGTATISWTLPITFGFRGLSLSDLNADGRIDLLTGQQGTNTSYWYGGTSGRVYLHTGNNAAPYATTPSFDLPVASSPGAYASFGPGRGTNGDWFSQPRPVYGTAFPNYGVLESMLMDSGLNGAPWWNVSATTQITAGTGITLFVAASDTLSALSNPTWVQVGALGNGAWSQTLSGVNGRYARYRVVLWRNATTEASPALQDITFSYGTLDPFSKSSPANGATGQPTNPTLAWQAVSGVNHYRYCYATTSGCVPSGIVGTNTSVALSGLTPGTTYYWQVRACADSGCTVFTDANGSGGHWSFTVPYRAFLPIAIKP